jgi:hypothetical protein
MLVFVANPLVIYVVHAIFPQGIFVDCSVFGKIAIPFLATFVVLSICLAIDKMIKLVRLHGVLN